MRYLRSIVILISALLTSSADARHPYRQGRPGYVTGPDGSYQAIPSSIEYTTYTIPKSYAVPTSIEYTTYEIPKPNAT